MKQIKPTNKKTEDYNADEYEACVNREAKRLIKKAESKPPEEWEKEWHKLWLEVPIDHRGYDKKREKKYIDFIRSLLAKQREEMVKTRTLKRHKIRSYFGAGYSCDRCKTWWSFKPTSAMHQKQKRITEKYERA